MNDDAQRADMGTSPERATGASFTPSEWARFTAKLEDSLAVSTARLSSVSPKKLPSAPARASPRACGGGSGGGVRASPQPPPRSPDEEARPPTRASLDALQHYSKFGAGALPRSAISPGVGPSSRTAAAARAPAAGAGAPFRVRLEPFRDAAAAAPRSGGARTRARDGGSSDGSSDSGGRGGDRGGGRSDDDRAVAGDDNGDDVDAPRVPLVATRDAEGVLLMTTDATQAAAIAACLASFRADR
jgi:hypothetical protein